MKPGTPDTLPPLCGHCRQGPVTRNTLGFPWCAEHVNRGELLDLGATLGFPQMDCTVAAIGPGVYCWTVLATCAADDLIWMLIDVIESGDAIEIEDIPEEIQGKEAS